MKDAFHDSEGHVLVGLADSGVDPDHPDLLAAQRPRPRGALLLDADADGLPDALETLIGLDPHNADSDGDGRPDGQELPFAAPGVSDPAVSDTVVPCAP